MAERIAVEQLLGLMQGVAAPPGLPFYRAVAHRIRSLAVAGRLPIGAQLPSERDVAVALEVSRTTTASAYRVLAETGVIETSHGRRATLQVPGGFASALLRSRADGVLDLVGGAPMPHDEILESLYGEAIARLPAFFGQTTLPSQGLLELREMIAQRFTDRGLATSPDEVMVTAGAADGLRQVFDSVTKEGDAVLVEQPTYPVAANMLARGGRKLIPLTLQTGKIDAWGVDRVTDAYLGHCPRAHYTIPDGHNPTGAVMSVDVRRRLASLADTSGSLLIVDETTAELTSGSAQYDVLPLARYVKGTCTALTVGSLSKVFWPGLRVGWVRAAAETIASLCLAPSRGDLGCSIVDQLTAIQVFRNFSKVKQLRCEQIERSKAAVLDALSEHIPDALCVPRQGFTLWVKLPRPLAVALFAQDERIGVRLSPGSQFGFRQQFGDHLRIPLVQSPEVLKEAVRRLALARTYQNTSDASVTYAARPLPMDSRGLRVLQ